MPAGKERQKIAVGDAVVYSSHGIGRVVAREQRTIDGTKREYVVIDLAADLRVALPLDEADDRLRPVLDAASYKRVQMTLAAEPTARDGSWTRRIKESNAKLAGGDALELAELVRDGARYEGAGAGSRLSAGERRIYLQARQLLVREICAARGLEEAAAEKWIEAQVAPPKENGD